MRPVPVCLILVFSAEAQMAWGQAEGQGRLLSGLGAYA